MLIHSQNHPSHFGGLEKKKGVGLNDPTVPFIKTKPIDKPPPVAKVDDVAQATLLPLSEPESPQVPVTAPVEVLPTSVATTPFAVSLLSKCKNLILSRSFIGFAAFAIVSVIAYLWYSRRPLSIPVENGLEPDTDGFCLSEPLAIIDRVNKQLKINYKYSVDSKGDGLTGDKVNLELSLIDTKGKCLNISPELKISSEERKIGASEEKTIDLKEIGTAIGKVQYKLTRAPGLYLKAARSGINLDEGKISLKYTPAIKGPYDFDRRDVDVQVTLEDSDGHPLQTEMISGKIDEPKETSFKILGSINPKSIVKTEYTLFPKKIDHETILSKDDEENGVYANWNFF